MKTSAAVLLMLALADRSVASERIGAIEFYGYKGVDVAKVRGLLPVHEGDGYSEETKEKVRRAVAAALGREATGVEGICCDENGRRLIYIGLPGESSKKFAYNPEPGGSERLPDQIVELYGRLEPAIEAAVLKGGGAAEEDESKGYSLIKDPTARAMQLEVRQWAVGKERILIRVLDRSSSTRHRQIASDALGYAEQSREQIQALVRAARDADDDVRNNATRALGVLVSSNNKLAAQIDPDTFIEMLNSGVWFDRNKASFLLMEMTVSRDADLLGKLRSSALDALIEMAKWRSGHAFPARFILGRVAGIPEDRLRSLAFQGSADEILKAIH